MCRRIGKVYLSRFVGLTLLLGALQASAAERSRTRAYATRADASASNQHVSLVSFSWVVDLEALPPLPSQFNCNC